MRLLAVLAAASLLGCASHPAPSSTTPVLVVREGPPMRSKAERKAERRSKRARRLAAVAAALGVVNASLSTAAAIKAASEAPPEPVYYTEAPCEGRLD